MHELVLNKINDFVQKMKSRNQSGSYYANKRQASTPYDDIALGKMGEFVTAYCLTKHFNYPIILPDFKIYESHQKNYDADLAYKSPLTPYHVKTCNDKTISFAKQKSWTFQSSDSLFWNPDSTDGISLVYLPHIQSVQAEVYITDWQEIKNKFKPPIAAKFRGSKRCLYINDLV